MIDYIKDQLPCSGSFFYHGLSHRVLCTNVLYRSKVILDDGLLRWITSMVVQTFGLAEESLSRTS